MPRNMTLRVSAIVLICSAPTICGCGDDVAPRGPVDGEIEAYLAEHPEENYDADEEADFMDEDAEFEAAEGE